MPRADISYDFEDFGKSQRELEAKYADTSEHPEYTLAKWKQTLSKHPELENTFNGYWDWVVTMIEADDDSIPDAGTAQSVAITESDMIGIDTIDQFAGYVTRWHQNKVAVLRHMQAIPSGTEMEVTIGDKAQTIKLEGELMAAFQTGLELALIEIGNLPFGVSTEGDEASNDAANPPQD